MRQLSIALSRTDRVSAILDRPRGARAILVLAHGAGAGMRHAFMSDLSAALAARAVATLRYQFPYTEAGRRRPDRPALLEATVRAAVGEATRRAPGLALFAGGKSMGGRMTSQAQAAEPLPGVRGILFVGFPLHPAGAPDTRRAEHLARVHLPMLFLQGTRDELAGLDLLRPIIEGLDDADLQIIDGADHAFKLPARQARARSAIAELADFAAAWIAARS